MSKVDLIIQHITMSKIQANESKALENAISRGVGLAGCHGGLGDTFRENTEYQIYGWRTIRKTSWRAG